MDLGWTYTHIGLLHSFFILIAGIILLIFVFRCAILTEVGFLREPMFVEELAKALLAIVGS